MLSISHRIDLDNLELRFDSRQGQRIPLPSKHPFSLAHPASCSQLLGLLTEELKLPDHETDKVIRPKIQCRIYRCGCIMIYLFNIIFFSRLARPRHLVFQDR